MLCLPVVSALITFPRAERDLFMVLASSRTFPSAPDFSTFSEPAKSTRTSFPVLVLSCQTFIDDRRMGIFNFLSQTERQRKRERE